MEDPVYKANKTIVRALILFIIDAFVLNQGAISVILILVILLWWLPKSLFLTYKKQSPKIQLTKSSIYGLMVICVFSANTINNEIAKSRAEHLVQVIEQYHQATGKYPVKLSNLVTTYIPKIPNAKYTLAFSEFWYINQNDYVTLFYVDMPPFGRPTYNFNKKSWSYMD